MNFKQSKNIPMQPTLPQQRPKRADAVANRALILATAQRLFAEQGIEKVCMAAIADTAKIGKGTLYRSFANKGELCLALMDEDMRIFQNKTLQRMREMAAQQALTRLDDFLDQLAHFMDFHAPLLREVQQYPDLQNDPDGVGRDSPQRWLPWLQDTLRILLEQAEHNHETANLDIPYLVDAILAPLNPDLFMYQREVLGFETKRISQGLRRLVMQGCQQSLPQTA